MSYQYKGTVGLKRSTPEERAAWMDRIRAAVGPGLRIVPSLPEKKEAPPQVSIPKPPKTCKRCPVVIGSSAQLCATCKVTCLKCGRLRTPYGYCSGCGKAERAARKAALPPKAPAPPSPKAVVRAARIEAAKIIREYVTQLKTAPCTDCKQTFPPHVMEFDHLDPKTKVASVSHMVKTGAPLEAVLLEIAKCELCCSNCHRIRTYNRKSS